MSYSEDFKASALAHFEACGVQRKTARQFDIPLSTLQKWIDGEHVNEATTAKVVAKKGLLADKLEELAHAIVDVAADKIGDAPLAASLTALGIAVDKMRLLREQPTSIAGQVTTVEERDAKLLEIVHKAKLRLVDTEAVA